MRIALFQAKAGIDPGANAAAMSEAVGAAAKGGAAMLFTPEMTGLLDRDRARSDPHVLPEAQEPTLRATRAAAARHGIWVQLGSLALRTEGRGRANRGFVIDAEGTVRARYDKLHLFDVDLPNGESWRESAVYTAGAEAVAVDTPVGRLGLSICYDLRFPTLYASLAEAGAELLAVPSAFTVPTGRAHWHVLLRARAIESAAFVVAAAQCGRHEDGRVTYGHSLVVNPWGEIILDMEDRNGVAFAEIDPALVGEVRRRLPALSHRRPIPDVRLA